MGYMLRYHDAFQTVSRMARDGQLGDVFHVRANMATYVPPTNPANLNNRALIARHRGGIFFDLGGHVLDQVLWITGRPRRVTAFLQNDATPDLPQFADNTIAVLEYERALANVEISCLTVSAGGAPLRGPRDRGQRDRGRPVRAGRQGQAADPRTASRSSRSGTRRARSSTSAS